MSIEEAWARLIVPGYSKDTAEAARALALAALEAAAAEPFGLCCPADAEFVAELRQRILALGKERDD